jgi:hypothetical protein
MVEVGLETGGHLKCLVNCANLSEGVKRPCDPDAEGSALPPILKTQSIKGEPFIFSDVNTLGN